MNGEQGAHYGSSEEEEDILRGSKRRNKEGSERMDFIYEKGDDTISEVDGKRVGVLQGFSHGYKDKEQSLRRRFHGGRRHL